MTQLPRVPLSVLDIAPVRKGLTPAQSLRETVDLARRVEELGYHRYWLAEHHNSPTVASCAPAVLIGQVASVTSTIRVGSGGVMLPNHSPLIVAEQFGTLAAIHPGRIDLGIGRAPGTDDMTARALRRSAATMAPDEFPRQLTELLRYFTGPADDEPIPPITAIPALGNPVPVWVLGSGASSAALAARFGLPYAFAHHFGAQVTVPAMRLYRESFQPSAILDKPYAIVAAMVIAGESEEHADWLAGPVGMGALDVTNDRHLPYCTNEEAAAYSFSAKEREFVSGYLASQIIGGPDTVRRDTADLLEASQADELMAITITYDHEDRVRSYELFAEAFALSTPASVQAG